MQQDPLDLEQPDLRDHPVVERDLMLVLVLLDLRDRLDLLDPLVWVERELVLLDLKDHRDTMGL